MAEYLGDEALDGLLREAGARCDAAGVRDLLLGVLAAPEPLDPDAWLALVAPEAGDALRDQLGALKREMAESEEGASDGDAAAQRLAALRQSCSALGVDGCIVPRTDEHQGEYLPARAQRLAWLTGFTGSAGAAVVLSDKAAVFTDGRYTLQVRQQVDSALYEIHHLTESPPHDWIAENLPQGGKLGYDPWLHTMSSLARLRTACERAGGTLVPLDENPVDRIWRDQPPPPIAPVWPHPLSYAGRSSGEKRGELAKSLADDGVDAAVLSAPDSIAWLLNLRGGDVPHMPIALSFAILRSDETVSWFIDRRKLTDGMAAHLGNAVSVEPVDGFGNALRGLDGRRILVDPKTAPSWVLAQLESAKAAIVHGDDPCALPKACKNDVELAGARAAHARDAVAVARFLAWLEREAPAGELTEIDAAQQLKAFRVETGALQDLSFSTISGAGPNGAIVHYSVTPESNRSLEPGSLYLVDSGGQYQDGTTDITRTVLIEPKPDQGLLSEFRDRFTRVLKGHIALATTRFPEGTTGSQLDALARAPLWRAGLDFDHGTGHGVGSYLGVHEGPQRISKLPNSVALRPGMIISNEPGYYKAGGYGIRIENLIAVRRLVQDALPEGTEKPFYEFETMTLAPIDRRLIDPSLMSPDETAWLDAYHARVMAEIGPALDGGTRGWLEQATQPLA